MKHTLSTLALALSGAVVFSAGAYAAQIDNPSNDPASGFLQAAVVGPTIGTGPVADHRSVIDPPSSIDPGMTLDPPQTGANTPIIHPPSTTPGGRLVLPR
jgi:hypothetical protein